MNKVILIGRLCADPEVRYSQNQNQTAVARYRLAVDRRYKRDREQTADFIPCVAFGKAAEFAEKYLRQGTKIAITGRIQTGSYTNKDGATVYTTEVVADRVEFLEWGDRPAGGQRAQTQEAAPRFDAAPEGFSAIDEDIPF